MIPNDPLFNNQWYLSAINAIDAWTLSHGSSNIIVAILDSGVDWEHYDLGRGNDSYSNIYTNPNEDVWLNHNNPNTGNGVDDDNNGLIDDWKGWNYSNQTNDTRTTNYHGTFVAGLISAKTNNNLGMAGIVGGDNRSGVKIIPYCVGERYPMSSVIDDAIIDAVDKGARIIQLSLSVSFSQAIEDAIQYATDRGTLIVCAAGNSNNTVSYPAFNTNVISVGATKEDLSRANFSNYGNDLDIMAPGVNI